MIPIEFLKQPFVDDNNSKPYYGHISEDDVTLPLRNKWNSSNDKASLSIPNHKHGVKDDNDIEVPLKKVLISPQRRYLRFLTSKMISKRGFPSLGINRSPPYTKKDINKKIDLKLNSTEEDNNLLTNEPSFLPSSGTTLRSSPLYPSPDFTETMLITDNEHSSIFDDKCYTFRNDLLTTPKSFIQTPISDDYDTAYNFTGNNILIERDKIDANNDADSIANNKSNLLNISPTSLDSCFKYSPNKIFISPGGSSNNSTVNMKVTKSKITPRKGYSGNFIRTNVEQSSRSNPNSIIYTTQSSSDTHKPFKLLSKNEVNSPAAFKECLLNGQAARCGEIYQGHVNQEATDSKQEKKSSKSDDYQTQLFTESSDHDHLSHPVSSDGKYVKIVKKPGNWRDKRDTFQLGDHEGTKGGYCYWLRRTKTGIDTIYRMFKISMTMLTLMFLCVLGFLIYFSVLQFRSFNQIVKSHIPGYNNIPTLYYPQQHMNTASNLTVLADAFKNNPWLWYPAALHDSLLQNLHKIPKPGSPPPESPEQEVSPGGNYLKNDPNKEDFPFIEHELENMPEEQLVNTFAMLNVTLNITNMLAENKSQTLLAAILGVAKGSSNTSTSLTYPPSQSGNVSTTICKPEQNTLQGSSSAGVKEEGVESSSKPKFENIQSLLRKTLKNKAHPSCSQMLVIPCLVFPYNGTVLPNMFGHKTQTQIWNNLKMYSPVFSLGCHPLSYLFFCTALAPKCGTDGKPINPCRSLCDEVSQHCSFFYSVFYLPNFPAKCSMLKESFDSTICVGGEEVRNFKRKKCDGFSCDTNRCINRKWICDGIRDCEDMTDERNCSATGLIENYNNLWPISTSLGAKELREGATVTNVSLFQTILPSGKTNKSQLSNAAATDMALNFQNRSSVLVFPSIDYSITVKTIYSKITNDRTSASYNFNLHCSTSNNDIKAQDTFSLKCQEMGYNETLVLGPDWRNKILQGFSSPHHPRRQSIAVRDFEFIGNDGRTFLQNLTNNRSICSIKQTEHVFACKELVCGRLGVHSKHVVPRIIGGQITKMGTWPWLVAIYGGPRNVYFCVGTIIHKRWIVTAAHCIGNQSSTEHFLIKVGDERRSAYNEYRQTLHATVIKQHPGFVRVVNEHDIALIKLDEDIKFNSMIQPVCLPETNFYPKIGTNCNVVGWGRTKAKETSNYSYHLNEITVPILSNTVCNEWLKEYATVKEGMLCAGYEEGKKDACQGDSGGPLMCKNEQNQWVIIGIVSWGVSCAGPKLPGVYTRVPLYVDWIIQTINEFRD